MSLSKIINAFCTDSSDSVVSSKKFSDKLSYDEYSAEYVKLEDEFCVLFNKLLLVEFDDDTLKEVKSIDGPFNKGGKFSNVLWVAGIALRDTEFLDEAFKSLNKMRIMECTDSRISDRDFYRESDDLITSTFAPRKKDNYTHEIQLNRGQGELCDIRRPGDIVRAEVVGSTNQKLTINNISVEVVDNKYEFRYDDKAMSPIKFKDTITVSCAGASSVKLRYVPKLTTSTKDPYTAAKNTVLTNHIIGNSGSNDQHANRQTRNAMIESMVEKVFELTELICRQKGVNPSKFVAKNYGPNSEIYRMFNNNNIGLLTKDNPSYMNTLSDIVTDSCERMILRASSKKIVVSNDVPTGYTLRFLSKPNPNGSVPAEPKRTTLDSTPMRRKVLSSGIDWKSNAETHAKKAVHKINQYAEYKKSKYNDILEAKSGHVVDKFLEFDEKYKKVSSYADPIKSINKADVEFFKIHFCVEALKDIIESQDNMFIAPSDKCLDMCEKNLLPYTRHLPNRDEQIVVVKQYFNKLAKSDYISIAQLILIRRFGSANPIC